MPQDARFIMKISGSVLDSVERVEKDCSRIRNWLMTTQIVTPNAGATQAGASVIVAPATTEIAVAVAMPGAISATLPDYMKNEPTGTELIGQYVTPPRIAIVQPLSDAEVKKAYGETACYASPSNELILPAWVDTNPAPVVRFVPIFFFPEFIEWNPRGVQGLNAIRSRTTDPKSELAQKCKSFETGIRNYPCPEKPEKLIRCQEHLNFVIMLLDHSLTGIPMMMSFSRTGHKDGRKLCDTIRMRRAPMYGLIFDLSIGPRSNDEGAWYGFDVRGTIAENGMSAFVDEEWFNYLKVMHLQMVKDYELGMLQAQYEESADEAATVAAPAAAISDAKRF